MTLFHTNPEATIKCARAIWLNKGLGLSLSASGEEMGLGRERVRQLRNQGLYKVREGDERLKVMVAALALSHELKKQ